MLDAENKRGGGIWAGKRGFNKLLGRGFRAGAITNNTKEGKMKTKVMICTMILLLSAFTGNVYGV